MPGCQLRGGTGLRCLAPVHLLAARALSDASVLCHQGAGCCASQDVLILGARVEGRHPVLLHRERCHAALRWSVRGPGVCSMPWPSRCSPHTLPSAMQNDACTWLGRG